MNGSRLGSTFALDTSTVNRQTAAMLRAGLVERIADPGGGIARKFRITPYGAERLRRHRAYSVEGLKLVMDGWTPGEVQELSRALARLNAGIGSLHRGDRKGVERDGAAAGGER